MKDKVQEIFNYICETIGFSIEKTLEDAAKPGPKTIRLGVYDIEKSLVKAYNYMQAEKPWLALHILKGTLTDLLDKIKNQNTDWLLENLDKMSSCVTYIKEANKIYDDWMNTEFKDFLSIFTNNNLFNDDELTPDKVAPDFFIELDESINDDLLKSFKYKTGSAKIGSLSNKKFKLNDQLYITDSIQEFMDYLKRTERDDNFVQVHFLMKIEPREDMSYFLLSFAYKDHVWLVTDMGFDFDNPRNKETTRNPRRRREKYYENVGFPYGYIDELDNIRKESKQIKKFDDKLSMELYIKPLKELPTYNKMFILNTVSHFLGKLSDVTDKLLTFEDHLNQKFLPGVAVEFDEKDGTGFIGWEEHIREVAEEALKDVRNGTSTEIVKISSDMVTSNKLYDRNWLGTPAQLDNIIKWTVLDTEANRLQKKLDAIAKHKDNSFDELNVMLNKKGNLERLIPFLFSAKNVYYLLENGLALENPNGGFYQKRESEFLDMKYRKGDRWFTKLHIGFDPIAFKERSDTWRNSTLTFRSEHSHDDYLFKPKCLCCGKFKVTKQFHLDIDHYEQLMFLCGIDDRKKLPIYFKSYRSNNCIPYHGNSILDNVHPFALIRHPAWSEYSDGLAINVHMCGNCVRKHYNKHTVAPETYITKDLKIIPYKEKEDNS